MQQCMYISGILGMLENNPEHFYIYHEAIAGGSGASMYADGLSGVQVHMTNTSNMPVEALEIEFPIILIKKYELRRDSGGAGQFRGGLGSIVNLKLLVKEFLPLA